MNEDEKQAVQQLRKIADFFKNDEKFKKSSNGDVNGATMVELLDTAVADFENYCKERIF